MPKSKSKTSAPLKALGVRFARKADLKSLAALLGQLFSQEAEFKPEPALQLRALRLILSRPSTGQIFVAEAGGRVVGMLSLLSSVSTALGGPVAWLEDLVVAPDWQGQGVGKGLLRAALAEARKRGWRRISLLTDADNLRSQGLYRKHGFIRSTMRVYRWLLS
ncbi:MAG TPA: GNAT family N-acetyltransferase [bacterium]|nr:GNAT family N-acetyltransferase [bacterium]